jgi:hypothetical protein
MIRADKYLELFEKNIILAGVETETLPISRVMVPVKNGKLDDTKFGNFLGNWFDYGSVLVVDWYGMLKKSTGFKNQYDSYTEVEVKRLRSDIVYFASIKIEDIVNLDKSLCVDFPAFKNYLVHLRGFKKTSKEEITEELGNKWT